MPIQFRCPGCSQPIEVDDPFAGKSAQCPYCRRVITVPAQTSLDAAAPVEARPSADAYHSPAQIPPPPLPPAAGSYGTYTPPESYGRPAHNAAPDRRGGGAAQLTGNLALMFTALTVILFVSSIVMAAPVFSQMARNP